MIELITVTRYRCTTCSQTFANPGVANDHLCWLDPAIKACPSCRHFDRGFLPYAVGDSGGNHREPSCMIAAVPPGQTLGRVVVCPFWEAEVPDGHA